MSLTPIFIETCRGQKILVMEPYYTTPLLETGLEIAETLSSSNAVAYLGPDALDCVTDETFHSRPRGWINFSRKRNPSRYLGDNVRKFRRPEIRSIKDALDLPDPRSFIDISDPALRDVRFENFDIGMGVISSMVSLTRDARVDLTRHEDYVMALAADALALYRLSRELIRQHAYDIVIFFNGRQAPVRAIRRACEAQDVRFLAYERGSSIDKYALFDCSTPHHPAGFRQWANSWWTVTESPDVKARQYLERRRAGNPPEWYSFTDRQELGYCPPGDSRPRVTFFTSSEDELVAVGDELSADSPLCDQAEAIRAVGLACRARGYEYVVRFHPNTAPSETRLFAAARDVAALSYEPASKVDTYALADSSKIIFTHSSTIGLEAAAAGKPVFYVGRNYFEQCHSVHRLRHEEEIAAALDRPGVPDPADALRYANYLASHGIPYRYYEPRGFFSGVYRGRDLNGPLLSVLRNAKLRFTRGGM